MVPVNHPTMKFPLNLEDRINYVKDNVNKILSKNVTFNEKENKKNNFELDFKLSSKPNIDDIEKLEKIGFTSKDKLKWSIIIN